MAQGANYIAFSVRGIPPGTAPVQQKQQRPRQQQQVADGGPPASSSSGFAGPTGVVAPGGSSSATVAAPTQAVYVGFNPNPEALPVSLPAPPAGLQWRRLIDSSRWGQLT